MRDHVTSRSLVSGSHIPIRGEINSAHLLLPHPHLLTLCPHHGAPTLSPLTHSTYLLQRGLELRTLKSGTEEVTLVISQVCGLSSLLVCSSLLPLSAERPSLLPVHGVQCCPSPTPNLTSKLSALTLTGSTVCVPSPEI